MPARNLGLKLDKSGIPQEPAWMEGHVRLSARQWEKLARFISDHRSELTRKQKLSSAKACLAVHIRMGRLTGISTKMVYDDNVFDEACKLAGVTKKFSR